MSFLKRDDETTDKMATFTQSMNFRDNNFDIIRLFLAILVLLSHSYTLLGLIDYEPAILLTHGQTCLGDIAVMSFFAISGFLVTQSWIRSKGILDYLKKRCLRIYPGFIVSMLFCALIIGPIAADNKSLYWHQFQPLHFVAGWASFKLIIPAVFGQQHVHSADNSIWTISYEFRCYLLVVLFGVLGALRFRLGILILFFLAFSLQARSEWITPGFYTGNTHFTYTLFGGHSLPLLGNLDDWPRQIACFLSGMVFWLYKDNIPRSRTFLFLSVTILALCYWWGFNVAFPVAGSYLLFYFAFSKRRIVRGITEGGGFFVWNLSLRFPNPTNDYLLFWPAHLSACTFRDGIASRSIMCNIELEVH